MSSHTFFEFINILWFLEYFSQNLQPFVIWKSRINLKKEKQKQKWEKIRKEKTKWKKNRGVKPPGPAHERVCGRVEVRDKKVEEIGRPWGSNPGLRGGEDMLQPLSW